MARNNPKVEVSEWVQIARTHHLNLNNVTESNLSFRLNNIEWCICGRLAAIFFFVSRLRFFFSRARLSLSNSHYYWCVERFRHVQWNEINLRSKWTKCQYIVFLRWCCKKSPGCWCACALNLFRHIDAKKWLYWHHRSLHFYLCFVWNVHIGAMNVHRDMQHSKRTEAHWKCVCFCALAFRGSHRLFGSDASHIFVCIEISQKKKNWRWDRLHSAWH